MISTPARGGFRGSGESDPSLRAAVAGPAIIVLLLLGLIVRLTIAYLLFPSSGFETDVATFASWALSMAEHGPGGFYLNAGFVDYPPAYLLLLWPIGLLSQASGSEAHTTALALVKLPPMLLDVAVAWVLFRLVLGWAGTARASRAAGLGAAALYLFNPVTLYDSALWGQTDAAGALVVLLGLAALIRGNAEGAAVMAVLAALVKPQFGVVLIPLVGIVLLRRHLLWPGTGPAQPPWGPSRAASWLRRHQGPERLLTSLLVGLAVFHLLALPFGLDIPGYLELMTRTAGGYSYLSVNAYNPWALVGSGDTPPLAASGYWSDDTLPLVGPLPGVVIGALALLAGFLWTIARAAVRDDRWTLLVAATLLCMAFFVLPTRVHERYIFPAFAILPLLAVMDRRWLAATLILAVATLINLHGVLTNPLYGSADVETLPFGELARSGPLVVLSALLSSGVTAWAAWRLGTVRATTPDAFERMASTGHADGVRGTRHEEPAAPLGARVTQAGPVRRAWAWLYRPAGRPDRSGDLVVEGPGRLDRLDALLLLLLVVASLTLRGYRLEQPYDMHFDEVYHARTATEFLQHWRYGQEHDIYEYTHPHLAKYLMALGISLAGENRVTGTSQLGRGVRDAVIEPRRDPMDESVRRAGDRLFVASQDGVAAYDLATRQLEAEVGVIAVALAVDDLMQRLYLVDEAGSLAALDTSVLDERRDHDIALPEPVALARLSIGPATRLVATTATVVAIGTDGRLEAVDALSGQVTGVGRVAGARDVVELPAVERLVLATQGLEDARAAATGLSEVLGLDAERLLRLIRAADGDLVVAAYLDEPTREQVEALLEDGRLAGARLESGPLLAVSGDRGISLLDALTLDQVDLIESLPAPPAGMVVAHEGFDQPRLYAATGEQLWVGRIGESGIDQVAVVDMPGPVRQPLWNDTARLVHVLGAPPAAATPATIYVVEPHGHAVFADAALAFDPIATLVDTQRRWPDQERGEILALSPDGVVASVDIDRNAFAWRLPGVLMGSLTVACLFLLARMLFRRRSVAVLAATLALAEGMLFANSRIAMNDVYVTGFLLAAATLFAPLYTGRWTRGPMVAAALVGTGLFLGLALASKWVGLYAVGALILLVLLRSALGRMVALAGMMVLTSLLGAMAVGPLGQQVEGRNWTFLLLMLGLTALLAAAMVRRPLALGRAEALFLVALIAVSGVLTLSLGLLLRTDPLADRSPGAHWLVLIGAAALGLAVGAAILLRVAARQGRGPLARPALQRDRPPPDPSAPAWLHPGRRLGLPWLFALACLGLLPILVYVGSYAPWVALGNQWLPGHPAGQDGQTLLELTRSMYEYHDGLRASHPASSPWWAWPLDLKPVWFYQEGFAEGTTGLIYDSGNLVVFWMGVAGLLFATAAAWRRRSLALTIVVVCFACLWLPWARIDRATFQYHYYASLPFVILALAYLLAELWHGPGRPAWLLARVGAAAAIVGAPVMWLAREPLCLLAGTRAAGSSGAACGHLERTASFSEATLVSLILLTVGVALATWAARRPPPVPRSPAVPGRMSQHGLPAVLMVLGITLVLLLAVNLSLSPQPTFGLTVSSGPLALGALLVLAVPAYLVLRARDPRRFVMGAAGAAVLWLLLWYPNLAGLPLPSTLAYVYQGLLPTWNYDFQFAVNAAPASPGGFPVLTALAIGVTSTALVASVLFVAHAWGADQGPEPAEGMELTQALLIDREGRPTGRAVRASAAEHRARLPESPEGGSPGPPASG